MSESVYGFEIANARSAIRNNSFRPERSPRGNIAASTFVHAVSLETTFSDLLPNPNPDFRAVDVVTACMDTFVENRHDNTIGLDVCFAFSNDRCRAAIGGNINEFYQYAINPTFTYLTSCVSYSIISIGPIINGTAHRGSMQTILMEVIPSITTTSMTLSTSSPYQSKANTAATALSTSKRKALSGKDYTTVLGPNAAALTPPRRFLWTLQQERRPPLQNCWMIHEVLYTKNAYQQTM